MTNSYKSDIVLGDEYEDSLTGLKGKATCTSFYLHGCERVALEFLKDGEVKYESFDAPRLIHVKTQAVPTQHRTGGPGGREPKRAATPEARR